MPEPTNNRLTVGAVAEQLGTLDAKDADKYLRARTPHGTYSFRISDIEFGSGTWLVLDPDSQTPRAEPKTLPGIRGTLRPTLVYLRDQLPGEPSNLVPRDLHFAAGQAIRDLPNSSRQLRQISLYNGAWYAEPVERRAATR